ncbi:MAG: hypothetical protein JWP81_67 [Ferruginibacter sp.]|nr:hypothetical protein [Ferruginibacter sp.]
MRALFGIGAMFAQRIKIRCHKMDRGYASGRLFPKDG